MQFPLLTILQSSESFISFNCLWILLNFFYTSWIFFVHFLINSLISYVGDCPEQLFFALRFFKSDNNRVIKNTYILSLKKKMPIHLFKNFWINVHAALNKLSGRSSAEHLLVRFKDVKSKPPTDLCSNILPIITAPNMCATVRVAFTYQLFYLTNCMLLWSPHERKKKMNWAKCIEVNNLCDYKR